MAFFVQFIRSIVMAAIRIYEFLLVARAIMSWMPADMSNPVVNFLYTVTEPLLAPIRGFLHRIPFFANLPIDFSMIVLFMFFEIIEQVL